MITSENKLSDANFVSYDKTGTSKAVGFWQY